YAACPARRSRGDGGRCCSRAVAPHLGLALGRRVLRPPGRAAAGAASLCVGRPQPDEYLLPPPRRRLVRIPEVTNAEQYGVIVRRADIMSAVARSLIAALNVELSSRYPEPGATHFRLDADEVAEGRGTFLLAMREHRPVGCGAVRRIEEQTGEIKRMYVTPE